MTAPRLSRRAVVVWTVLAAGVVALLQVDRAPPDPRDAHDHGPAGGDDLPEGRFRVFAFGEPDIGSVTIAWKGRHVDFGREWDGRWARVDHAHAHDAGDGAHAHGGSGASDPEEIAEQLAVSARMLADRAMAPDRSLGAYGLADPEIRFTFRDRLNGDPLAVMHVGDLLVNGFAYYVALDGNARRLLLVPRYQVNLLLALAFGDEAPSPLPAGGSGEAVPPAVIPDAGAAPAGA